MPARRLVHRTSGGSIERSAYEPNEFGSPFGNSPVHVGDGGSGWLRDMNKLTRQPAPGQAEGESNLEAYCPPAEQEEAESIIEEEPIEELISDEPIQPGEIPSTDIVPEPAEEAVPELAEEAVPEPAMDVPPAPTFRFSPEPAVDTPPAPTLRFSPEPAVECAPNIDYKQYPEDYPEMLLSKIRLETLRKYLVQPSSQPIQYDATVGWELVKAFLLEENLSQRTGFRSKKVSRKVLKLAAKIRFTENAFTVQHYLLHDFFYNPENTRGLDEPITALIRRITVVIPTELRPWSDKECTTTLEQLRILLQCSNIEHVAIELVGNGDLAGTDWPTQNAIRVIAPVVADLLAKFGSRFSISKVISQSRAANDITRYWSELETEKKRTKPNFEEIMRGQLKYWSKVG